MLLCDHLKHERYNPSTERALHKANSNEIEERFETKLFQIVIRFMSFTHARFTIYFSSHIVKG